MERKFNVGVICMKKMIIYLDLTFWQEIGVLEFMSKLPARVIDYSNYDENMEIECSICNRKGTPKTSGWIDTDSHYCLSVSCPVCEKMILVANYASA